MTKMSHLAGIPDSSIPEFLQAWFLDYSTYSINKEVKDEATEDTSAGGFNIKEEIIDEDESRNATVYSTVLIHVPESIKEEIIQESMDTEDPLL